MKLIILLDYKTITKKFNEPSNGHTACTKQGRIYLSMLLKNRL